MIKLSKTQEKIVKHIDGAILVKAGPGSGKTRVLIERIKYLLLQKKRYKILALTFSNLAADEMRNRLEEDNSISELVNNVTLGTIHSFCLDLVQSRGNLIGLENDMIIFENSSDQQSVLRDVFLNTPQLLEILNEKEDPSKFLQMCLSLISEQKRKFVSPEFYTDDDTFKYVYREYNQLMRNQNALDFDDILFYAYQIFIDNPAVVNLYTSMYKFICVDEAQDLNFAQYAVIKALCGDKFKNIMLVGDENQSIYGFNGSDSTIMTKQFKDEFAPTEYLLNENHRSAKAIVDFANKLENCDSTSSYIHEGELSAFVFENEQEEAEFVLNKINELCQNGHKDIEGKLKYDSFAIIARNKYVLNNVEELFKEQEIPYFYKKSSAGIGNESEYMKVFELGIHLVINSKDIVHLKEICEIVKSSMSEAFIQHSGYEALKEILSNTVYTNLLSSFDLLSKEDFDFKKVIDNIKKNIPNELDEDAKYLIGNDLIQWEKHWKKYISQVLRENRSLISFRSSISLGKTQDITSNNGVALLTAHMSKGLQYEVVFVVGLSEGTFPDYRAVKSGGTEMEQEKNNMYVAVTRAKRLCYLSYPKNKMMPWNESKKQEPSRYLENIKSIN